MGRDRSARTRRHLFNGDCNFLFYNPELWQPEGGPFSVRAIERHLAALAAGGIDTLLVNPNTQVAWYPSGKNESVLAGYRRGDARFARSIAAGAAGLTPALADKFAGDLVALLDRYLDLAEAGVDWLAECARLGRALGMSPWLSYRMNPTHFSAAPDCPANCRLFRDPANRLSGRGPGAPGRVEPALAGLDYSRPAVRHHMLALIREGLEAYDYEGLEMDWLRHPVCLEPPATSAQIGMMTGWFSEVRALTQSLRPGCALGIRAPASLPYLRSIGIDLPELAGRGIIDFCTFSNFWQTPWEMPLDELRRALGPDLVIYGGMENAPNWLEALAPGLAARPSGPDVQLAGDRAFHAPAPPAAGPVRGTRYLSASAALLRGNAAGKLALGADGLEQFNFFVTDQVRVPGLRADYAALRGLDRLESLRGREKHYCCNTPSALPAKLWDVPAQLPVRLAPRQRHTLRLPMCAEPAGAGLTLTMQLVTDRRHPGGDRCGVSLNGGRTVFAATETRALLFPAGPYTHHVEEHRAWNYTLDCAALRDGWNEFTLHNESAAALSIVAVEAGLRRGDPPVVP
jgi:hypothetical protein